MQTTLEPLAPYSEILTDDEISRFRKDGYIAFRNVLAPAEIATCKAALSALMREYLSLTPAQLDAQKSLLPAGYPEWAKFKVQFEPGAEASPEADDMDAMELKVRKLEYFYGRQPALDANVHAGHAVYEIISQLIGRSPIHFQDMALVKPPFIGSEKPWHQDNAYFNVTPLDSTCGVWIALDDATVENGCMHVIPGGHTLGALRHHHDRDCEIVPGRIDDSLAIPVPIPAGGAMFFCGMLPHQTPPNHSGDRRRALQFHFRGQHSTLTPPEEYDRVYAEADGTPASCAAAKKGI